jgi:HD-GYP domain-containing protein (c-di-GMP phosphodiesterase class II)
LGLPKSSRNRVHLAGLFHDIGLISTGEKIEWVDDALYNVHNHAFLGARLLAGIKVLKHVSAIVKYHHIPHRFGLGSMYLDEKVPIESHILHLADRACALIDNRKEIFPQVSGIARSIVERKETIFIPELADAFLALSENRQIWMELSGELPLLISQMPFFTAGGFASDDLADLSRFVSQIIDFRSSFTANHSAGVAKTASTLASLAGFPASECRVMLIAGYLHDLGKLAVDISLLDKPTALTPEEFQTVKRHAFHTYRLLSMVKGFSKINTWASLHHEKLNGTGYPFGLKGKDIPLGARIMAVADIFTAVTEDRPYRKGMNREEVLNVFETMVKEGALCPNVVNLLVDNIELVNYVLADSLKKANVEYRLFKSAAV